jgi:hypothetical protein
MNAPDATPAGALKVAEVLHHLRVLLRGRPPSPFLPDWEAWLLINLLLCNKAFVCSLPGTARPVRTVHAIAVRLALLVGSAPPGACAARGARLRERGARVCAPSPRQALLARAVARKGRPRRRRARR